MTSCPVPDNVYTLSTVTPAFFLNNDIMNVCARYNVLVLTPAFSQNNDASLQSRYTLSILLEPQSLLVLQHDMYTGHLHGIREQSEDTVSAHVCNFGHLASPVAVGDVVQRSTRVSLTIRHVPKTLKVKLKLGK